MLDHPFEISTTCVEHTEENGRWFHIRKLKDKTSLHQEYPEVNDQQAVQ